MSETERQVFVVTAGPYLVSDEGTVLCGVYTTGEKAQAAADEVKRARGGGYVWVDPLVLDASPKTEG